MIKPVQPLTSVPEGNLLNLDNGDVSYTPPSKSEVKRQTGFAKRPGVGPRRRDDLYDGSNGADSEGDDEFEEEDWIPDIFLFEYGTVVLWGMTEKEEKHFLRSL